MSIKKRLRMPSLILRAKTNLMLMISRRRKLMLQREARSRISFRVKGPQPHQDRSR